ncbi:MAG: Hydrogenase assembly chaperone HypC/HupF [Berkelbacteria bacterium GW2011_GWA2_38_9]|uniref:Hydrogenase assembly chaperone HypC/HupF n=1 Tax=Berkelbacteria bacterium GW2011_GWA2_38_9 TaxID=1618334 RepID=A0A0G0LIU7_9BACT|nr:MAG: Hydrogenase assembly chaperone HypC/HupF [Berkelbacteria bacterium GW2011_GWA2_38_9]
MCLATPMKILSRDGSWCQVEGAGHEHRVNVDLVPDVKPGDFVIAHADLAIGVVEPEEALEIEKVNAKLNH